eukprot:TRINITY_DN120793_c0_g1_i1.p1 TRINITY_DN120793_c0_g1~~TRINITY_DN120793_c0_g1_i1.p1  ORF type:complete len:796 (+),score=151.65 TRINITY_DN120793_c0_g1_i1:114-2501(+)
MRRLGADEREAVRSGASGAAVRPAASSESLERFSGLKISNRAIRPQRWDELMKGKQYLSLEKLSTSSPAADLGQGNVVMIGVVYEKSAIRTSGNGNRYAHWAVTDLSYPQPQCATVFLHGEAFDVWMGDTHLATPCPVGSIIAILNPSPLADKGGNSDPSKQRRGAGRITHGTQVVLLGASPSMGLCSCKKKDGLQCSMPCDRDRGGLICYYHTMQKKAQEIRGFANARRADSSVPKVNESASSGGIYVMPASSATAPGKGSMAARPAPDLRTGSIAQSARFVGGAGSQRQEEQPTAAVGVASGSTHLPFGKTAAQKAGDAAALRLLSGKRGISSGKQPTPPSRGELLRSKSLPDAVGKRMLPEAASQSSAAPGKVVSGRLGGLEAAAAAVARESDRKAPAPVSQSGTAAVETLQKAQEHLMSLATPVRSLMTDSSVSVRDVVAEAEALHEAATRQFCQSAAGKIAAPNPNDSLALAREEAAVRAAKIGPSRTTIPAAKVAGQRLAGLAAAVSSSTSKAAGNKESSDSAAAAAAGPPQKRAWAGAAGAAVRGSADASRPPAATPMPPTTISSEPARALKIVVPGITSQSGTASKKPAAMMRKFEEQFGKKAALAMGNKVDPRKDLVRKQGSRFESVIEEERSAKRDRELAQLEAQDEMAAKMEALMSLTVHAWKCEQCCKVTDSQQAKMLCEKDGHKLTQVKVEKTRWECRGCRFGVSSLDKELPAHCNRCNDSNWKQVPLNRTSKAPMPKDLFLARGEELPFLNSLPSMPGAPAGVKRFREAEDDYGGLSKTFE